ncbi:Uncharacterised protein [Chryseobacterium taklimakanense]|uniref:Cyclic GMP-AMP synthase n=1 Tax=Chryseobacterium taklimakanense TaxID=536441 RepID=A0A239WMD2_9FLAO|nr:hypothetical protein [Chryseobacterium taklimakanense]SNV35260.1 Uncharacterised protein [Chryseobacterium taklimakanense]
MANNHEQFIAFNDAIKLNDTKKEELRENRDALRKKIEKYFNDNLPNETKPGFHAQGSFMMFTTVNPIPIITENEDGDTITLRPYDLDDGIYFIDKLENKKESKIYRNWIYDAVKCHTSKGAEKKASCIRVNYADGHNIDLPIYFEEKDKKDVIPELAQKSGYIESDPIEFLTWFNDLADEQLRRIVRYFKAWRDKQMQDSDITLPPGIILTILVSNNYVKNDRDDISLQETLQKIKNELDINYVCYRPTTKKDEELLKDYDKTHFLDRLSKFIESANEAVNHSSQKEACKKWQKHLGERFSCSNIKEENESNEAKSFSSPAIINKNAESA